MLKVREERAGRNLELEELLPALFDKVIPRLLRPLESEGRTIKPSFVHGDLWGGETRVSLTVTQEMASSSIPLLFGRTTSVRYLGL